MSAKLTEQDVREIRRRTKEEGATRMELAREYGVGYYTIRDIVQFRTWVHLDKEGLE